MDSVLRGWVIGHPVGEAISRRRDAQRRWCAIAYFALATCRASYPLDDSDRDRVWLALVLDARHGVMYRH